MITLQLDRSRVSFHAPDSEVTRLRRHFDKHHFVRLRRFISPELLKDIREDIKRGTFFKKVHGNIGVELCMRESASLRALKFVSDDPSLFKWVQKITGCGPIGCFTGRIYRMVKGNHHDDWHNDMTENRLVAMSVNLSDKVYKGGSLLMREVGKPKSQIEVPNTGPGDAILFRLSHDLEHLVDEVRTIQPKTAYAGWFRSKPDYRQAFSRRRKQMGIKQFGVL